MKRTPLIAGNWKMNGRAAAIDAFAHELRSSTRTTAVDALVCVPFVYVERLARQLADTPVAVGGENLSAASADGALTGEVSGAMLADVGCSHVIVGHSERRALFGETDAMVARKANAAVAAGLQPIVCIGETLEQRRANQAEAVLAQQLQAVLDACDATTLAALTIAYEPIWAIGTGHSATPEQAQAMHEYIRQQIAASDDTLSRSMRLLYGGSVKPDNAAQLFAGDDVDGALIGGASLKAASFLDIVRAAS